jgi:C4-dicarboxylate transporter DctM subunit
MNILIYVGVPILLLAAGLPVFVVLLMTAIVGVIATPGLPFEALHTTIFGSIDASPLLAIPLFVLAGDIMGHGGLAKRIVAWAMALVGGIRGSLALTTIASCELFGAMSGSSVGCIAAVGKILYPGLNNGGYGTRFASGLIASGGAIAVIIPPSIPMIIYGITAQQSIPALFLAGIVPGLLVGVLLAVYILAYARIKMIPLTSRARWTNILYATKDAVWSLGAPVVILGGIYGGVFTPTEAAGVAVVYAASVSLFIYKEMTWRDLMRVTYRSTFLVAQIMIIVAGAGAYAWLVTTSGLPQELVSTIGSWNLSLWVLLLLINIILLIVGSFLEPPAAILVLTPLLLPLVQGAGVDLIHFGIIMTVNLAIGMFMPPFGLNLFGTHAIFHVPLKTLYIGVLPFLAINLIALMIVTYVPTIALLPLQLLGR